MTRPLTALALIGVACSVVGCKSTAARAHAERRRGNPVRTETVSDRLRLVPVDASSEVEAEFLGDVQLPEGEELARFVNDCLSEAYRHMRGEARTGVSTTGLRGVRDAFFADYREWFDAEWDAVKAGDLPAHVGDWGCQVEGRIVHCDGGFFSYRVTIDAMTGGVHPNRWIQNATYSRRSGRRLTVADVIRRQDITQVVNLIRRTLRTHCQDELLRTQLKEDVQQPYDAYVRDIRSHRREEWGNPLVTENFLVTADGLEWVYNQYEIACYAAGIFTVPLTWAVLSPHLCANFLAK